MNESCLESGFAFEARAGHQSLEIIPYDQGSRVLDDGRMDVLVAIDSGYIAPFKVLAASAVLNTPEIGIRFILMHSDIDAANISALHLYCDSIGADFVAIRIDEDAFGDVPVTRRYPAEVYFRLLAPHVLPSSLKRVVYLDCDMLVINSLAPLWNLDMEGNACAAASHSGDTGPIDALNQLRLDTDHPYFNTGLLVMELARAREVLSLEKLAECVEDLGRLIVLPDQDVFNACCGESTLALDDEVWNYDARKFVQYRAASLGEHDMDWVMGNTAVLHFCGPRKPWKKSYAGRFGSLYKHYVSQTMRLA